MGVLFLNACKLHVTLCKQQEINIQIYEGPCFGFSRSTVSGSTADLLHRH